MQEAKSALCSFPIKRNIIHTDCAQDDMEAKHGILLCFLEIMSFIVSGLGYLISLS